MMEEEKDVRTGLCLVLKEFTEHDWTLDSGKHQPHIVNYNEKVALEQLVADNVSSPAVILHISTANKVGENQWKFHVLTSGNISPC